MTEEIWYCLPVLQTGSVYRDALSAVASFSRDLLPFAHLEKYLTKHYHTETATVFLLGRPRRTEVFVPNHDKEELSYVLVDGDYEPPHHDDEATTSVPNQTSEPHESMGLVRHFAATYMQCSVTEALYAPSSLRLPQSFIRPRLARAEIDAFGLPRKARTERLCSVEDFAAESRAVLLGAPGSGKTTLLRYLVLRFADVAWDSTEARSIPVYAQLRHFDPIRGLTAFLPFEEKDGARSLRPSLRHARIAWVLDGLDECPIGHLPRLKAAILDLVRHRNDDSVLLCSRNSSYDGFLKSECTHYVLQPFSWLETSQWVHQILQDAPGEPWRPLLHALANVRELSHIAGNPLLLSVLTHSFFYATVIPQQKAQLLERFVNTLCEDWDSARGINRRTDNSIPPYKRSTLLALIAFEMKRRNVRAVSDQAVESWLEEHALVRQKDIGTLLGELAEDTGLIMPTSTGVYEFSHQLFCDYLAARHLVGRTDDVSSLLDKLATEDDWQEVWILTCAITHDASHLLRKVLDSETIGLDSKALLLTGALAQGVEIASDLLTECRRIILSSFVEVVSRMEFEPKLRSSDDGARSWLALRPMAASSVHSAEREAAIVFLRRLARLLYRALWWAPGQSIVRALGERAGGPGRSLAGLLSCEGTLHGPVGSREIEGEWVPLLLEVDSKLEGEGQQIDQAVDSRPRRRLRPKGPSERDGDTL